MSDHEYPEHPRIGVGAVIIRDGKVLLVRRSRPPAEGLWAIPGGRLELGETLQQAAERELLEETGVRIRAREPLFTFDVIEKDDAGAIRYHYVIVDLAADYISGTPSPRDDVIDARWISPEELDSLPTSTHTMDLLRNRLGF